MSIEYWRGIVERNKLKILVTLGVLFVLGILISFKLIMFMLSSNAECLDRPFTYHAQRLYEEGMEVQCTCTPLDSKYNVFDFDRYDIIVRNYNDYYEGSNIIRVSGNSVNMSLG